MLRAEHRGLNSLLAALALVGCARTLPPDRASAGLYRDLQRLVVLSAATGWRVDREEVRDLAPEALMSVCRVKVAARQRLRQWLEQRIADLGGPVERAYRQQGRDLDAVEDLLELTRIQLVLEHALARADVDCPFWLEPDPSFAGIQLADDRWMLSFGGGGKVIGVYEAGQADFGFGGAGRLAFGRAFGSRWALLGGFEFGGSGAFPRSAAGDPERGSLEIAFDTVFQSILRFRRVNSYWELETGYLMRFYETDTRIRNGIHAGIAFGLRAARKEWILPGALFPGAGFAVIYERVFPRGEGTIQMIKIGFRGAFDVHY